MTTARIKSFERVRWTSPGGGIRNYEGTVLCFVPAGKSLGEMRSQMQGLAYVTMMAKVQLSVAYPNKRDRYVVCCGLGMAAEFRLPNATLLERQNPHAERQE